MGKATAFYIFTVLLAIFGLWAVIRVGNTLTPPRNVAGSWVMTAPAGAEPTKTITIELSQSGKYLVVTHPGAKPMSLVLADDKVIAGQPWQMNFKNSSQQLVIQQAAAPENKPNEQWAQFQFQGTLNETLLGQRLVDDPEPANAGH